MRGLSGQERPVCEREVLTHSKCKFVFSREADLRRSQVKKGVGIGRKEPFESSKPTFLGGIKKSKESGDTGLPTKYFLLLLVKNSP